MSSTQVEKTVVQTALKETTENEGPKALNTQKPTENGVYKPSEEQTEPWQWNTSAQPVAPLDRDQLLRILQKQIDHVFTKDYLATDPVLVQSMDGNHFMPIENVMQVATVFALTKDKDLVLEALEKSEKAVFNSDKTAAKPTEQLNKRNTIIIRDIPSNTVTEEDIKALFGSEYAQHIVSVRSDVSDTWFVVFKEEDQTVDACFYLRSQKYNDKPISCRIKSETLLKGFYYQPQTVPAAYGYPNFYQNQMANGGQHRYNHMWRGDRMGQDRRGYRGDSRGRNNKRFNRGRGRNGYNKRNQMNYSDGQNENRNTNGNRGGNRGKRKTSRGRPAKPNPATKIEFTSSHFPPLPSPDGDDVQSYSREQILAVILEETKKGIKAPSFEADDCPVVLKEPVVQLEQTKPISPEAKLDVVEDKRKVRDTTKAAPAKAPAPDGKVSVSQKDAPAWKPVNSKLGGKSFIDVVKTAPQVSKSSPSKTTPNKPKRPQEKRSKFNKSGSTTPSKGNASRKSAPRAAKKAQAPEAPKKQLEKEDKQAAPKTPVKTTSTSAAPPKTPSTPSYADMARAKKAAKPKSPAKAAPLKSPTSPIATKRTPVRNTTPPPTQTNLRQVADKGTE